MAVLSFFFYIAVVSSFGTFILYYDAMLVGQTNSLTSLNRRFISFHRVRKVIARILDFALLNNYN